VVIRPGVNLIMLVFIAVVVFVCSCIDDLIMRSAARQIQAETGRPFIECLAAVKHTTVEAIQKKRNENAMIWLISIFITILLYV